MIGHPCAHRQSHQLQKLVSLWHEQQSLCQTQWWLLTDPMNNYKWNIVIVKLPVKFMGVLTSFDWSMPHINRFQNMHDRGCHTRNNFLLFCVFKGVEGGYYITTILLLFSYLTDHIWQISSGSLDHLSVVSKFVQVFFRQSYKEKVK